MARAPRSKQSRSQARRTPSSKTPRKNRTSETRQVTQSTTEENSIKLKSHLQMKTPKQKDYLQSIIANVLTFGVGPAGTGKTMVALYAAAKLYASGVVKQIVIIRAAVEAGEKLGFLPGDEKEKTDPYFETVVSNLKMFLEAGRVDCDIKSGNITCKTLAFLRSGTLRDAVVIIEEAQNLTVSQMKLALTRAGENTKYIIAGDDEEQCDLPKHVVSGLTDARRRFGVLANASVEENPEGISVGMIIFNEDEIVRSGLCKMAIKQYRKPLSSF